VTSTTVFSSAARSSPVWLVSHSFWAFYAAIYDLIWDSPVTADLAALARATLPSDGRIVDLGCGTGLIARSLDGAVSGIDSSRAMLRRAMTHRRIHHAIERSAEASGLPDGFASGVLVCNLLHLHRDPHSLVSEALRICAPGGMIFATWPIDGLDLRTLCRVERRAGRSAVSTMTATALRWLVGGAASLSGLSPRSSAEIEAALEACGAAGVSHGVAVDGCQRVVVLRR